MSSRRDISVGSEEVRLTVEEGHHTRALPYFRDYVSQDDITNKTFDVKQSYTTNVIPCCTCVLRVKEYTVNCDLLTLF